MAGRDARAAPAPLRPVNEIAWAAPEVEVTGDRAVVVHQPIATLSGLQSYSLRNGETEDIVPYLLTASIPAMYHWIPINGLAPRDALRCMDGFIRSYLYKVETTAPPAMADVAKRKIALILGVCRAIMCNNFDLLPDDMNAQELAPPLLSVVVPEEGAPVYTALVAANAPNVAKLTGDIALTHEELEVVKVLARSAQAIIPVQGVNLINDGHHYLSDRNKQSFKSFFAVEKQLWLVPTFKDWFTGSEEIIRDTIWHKAGHPVTVYLKEYAASSKAVAANLIAAKMGSAAARLPALDAEVRAADTYLKLAEAVGAVWATMGGSVRCELLRVRVEKVKDMPRGDEVLGENVDMGAGLIVSLRSKAVEALAATVEKNTEKAAVLYGFYCSMVEDMGNNMTGQTNDTLRAAYSLKKLASGSLSSVMMGGELYRDYKAAKIAARRSRDIKMPVYSLDV